ncbi:hypothetical protein ES703_103346 [subsurface metagenome]
MKAKTATNIGMGETITLALLISICSKLLYQNKTSKPYKTPIIIKNKILIGSNKKEMLSNGKNIKYVVIRNKPEIKYLMNDN